MKDIKICMGSACFAKGGQENLEFIKSYIEQNGLDDKVSCTGELCTNQCADGPRVIIDGVEHKNVTKEMLAELLQK